jgi:2-iminobutanoate/2-iminopropanoate deaminase
MRATPEGANMVERNNFFPDALSKRVVGGHVLYAPVVTVVPGRLVFISGLLARNREGEIVGKGDMRRQIRQVGENLKAALAAAGASLSDLVRTQTFTTDIDEFFRHVDVRMEYFGSALPTSTTVEVRRLSHPDFLVEIEAMAVIA